MKLPIKVKHKDVEIDVLNTHNLELGTRRQTALPVLRNWFKAASQHKELIESAVAAVDTGLGTQKSAGTHKLAHWKPTTRLEERWEKASKARDRDKFEAVDHLPLPVARNPCCFAEYIAQCYAQCRLLYSCTTLSRPTGR